MAFGYHQLVLALALLTCESILGWSPKHGCVIERNELRAQ